MLVFMKVLNNFFQIIDVEEQPINKNVTKLITWLEIQSRKCLWKSNLNKINTQIDTCNFLKQI